MLRMDGYMDGSASVRAFVISLVAELRHRLIDGGAPLIHFYALNQLTLTPEICNCLN